MNDDYLVFDINKDNDTNTFVYSIRYQQELLGIV